MDFLKKACWSTVVSFKDLPIGDYIVTEFKLVTTKNYGVRLTAILGDKQVFLPNRFSKDITEEIVTDLNKTPKIMSYTGRDERRGDMVLLDFKDADINQLTCVNQQQLDDDAELLTFIQKHESEFNGETK